jgi:hypothetical protein
MASGIVNCLYGKGSSDTTPDIPPDTPSYGNNLVPAWETNSNSYQGYEISVSSHWGNAKDYPAYPAFDKKEIGIHGGSEPEGWYCSSNSFPTQVSSEVSGYTGNAWIQVKLPFAKIVKSFLVRNNHTSEGLRTFPITFSLQGSNDGSSFVTLYTASEQSYTAEYEAKRFSISNNTAYLYYRLNITKSKNNYVGIGEFEIFD